MERTRPHRPHHRPDLPRGQALKIGVQAYCEGDRLVRIQLSPATSFSCSITGASPAFEDSLLNWLQAYSKGKTLPLPLQLTGNRFKDKVLRCLATIPFGETRSYKEVAEACGSPLAMRAVGNACRGNPFPLIIPCHRVIASNGSLGGFTPGLPLKQQLLAFEALS